MAALFLRGALAAALVLLPLRGSRLGGGFGRRRGLGCWSGGLLLFAAFLHALFAALLREEYERVLDDDRPRAKRQLDGLKTRIIITSFFFFCCSFFAFCLK